jgi:hypothetical protein
MFPSSAQLREGAGKRVPGYVAPFLASLAMGQASLPIHPIFRERAREMVLCADRNASHPLLTGQTPSLSCGGIPAKYVRSILARCPRREPLRLRLSDSTHEPKDLGLSEPR